MVRVETTEFGKLLDALIKERCGSIAAFVASIEASGVSTHHSQISRIINGSDPVRRPPLDQLDAWCDALRLSAKEARSFRFEAELCHCPDSIVEWIRAQAAREERQKRIIAQLTARMHQIATRSHPTNGAQSPPPAH